MLVEQSMITPDVNLALFRSKQVTLGNIKVLGTLVKLPSSFRLTTSLGNAGKVVMVLSTGDLHCK
jgi:hypothetical protein